MEQQEEEEEEEEEEEASLPRAGLERVPTTLPPAPAPRLSPRTSLVFQVVPWASGPQPPPHRCDTRASLSSSSSNQVLATPITVTQTV